MKRSFFILLLAFACCSIAMAKGRRPDDDEEKDSFPDYNRMEVHRKPIDTPPPATSDSPAFKAPAPTPALNTPVNPSGDEDTPKAPPAAVPVSDGASEPPLPDEIKDNLIQGTTDQK